MEYTVILLHYNQIERLKWSIKKWLSHPIPPTEILIMDDGSENANFEFVKEYNKVRLIQLPHKANLSASRNRGVDECKTERFIFAEPSAFPAPGMIEFQLEHATPEIMISGIYINVDQVDSIPQVVFDPPVSFEINTIWMSAPDFNIHFKSTYLYYNEAYEGWGAEDNDYLARWLFKGYKIIRSTQSIGFHWNHSKNSSFYDEAKHKKNVELLAKLIQYYQMRKVYDLSAQRTLVPI